MQKETLGWVFDGARRCTKLPNKKTNTIINEIKPILRTSAIPYKKFERLVENLRHLAIGLPVGRGVYASFNRTIATKSKVVSLGKNGAVYAVFLNWKKLLTDMQRLSTHVNELVPQEIPDVGNMEILGIGAGGVWISTSGTCQNIVWRMEWPAEISKQFISDSNLTGLITNSDLAMAIVLLQWLLLKHFDTKHQCSAIALSDNTLAPAWATHVTTVHHCISIGQGPYVLSMYLTTRSHDYITCCRKGKLHCRYTVTFILY